MGEGRIGLSDIAGVRGSVSSVLGRGLGCGRDRSGGPHLRGLGLGAGPWRAVSRGRLGWGMGESAAA